jgi:multicomponent Na+:H+ antiporter subunit D
MMLSAINMETLLPALVGLPLVGAILTALLTNYKWQLRVSLTVVILQVLVVIQLLGWLTGVEASDGARYTLGGWQAPLGIALSIDGLSAVMIGLTTAITAILTIYCRYYFDQSHRNARFWPLWWMLNLGINALFLSSDIFNIYVALEIIGLTSVALVALGGTRAALTAALRYLLVGLLGSLCYLLAVALLYYSYGTLDMTQLADKAQATPITGAALIILTAGLVLKTALVPLHFWLPLAHGSAPAPVSAVLSALVVKTSFYLLARFWLDILTPAVTDQGLMLLGVMGAGAIVWGSLKAISAKRLKLMVAYSTVAQLGYLFLLFPLLITVNGADSPSEQAKLAAISAAAYFIVAHACAKAAMFVAAGNIMRAAGHDDISRLKGIVRHMPLSVFTFAIAGASLIGLPPTAGFIAKWLMLNVAIDSGQWWWSMVILGGGLLATIAIFRVLNMAFSNPEEVNNEGDDIQRYHKLPMMMHLCGLSLAILAMVLGFNAPFLLELLAVGAGA